MGHRRPRAQHKDLAKAVSNGRKFLEREHPEAKRDFVELLSQMRITIAGLAGGKVVASEASRFNDYVVKQKGKVALLHNNIRALKGSCERIRVAHEKLNAPGGDNWTGMFRLFNARRRVRQAELASALGRFYEVDQEMIGMIRRLLDLAETALNEANQMLGPPAFAYPARIGSAAEVLGVCSASFNTTEKDLRQLVEDLNESIMAIG